MIDRCFFTLELPAARQTQEMDQVPKKEQSSALPSDTTGLPVFNREEFAELLDAVAKTHMPFGKYGPAAYPP